MLVYAGAIYFGIPTQSIVVMYMVKVNFISIGLPIIGWIINPYLWRYLGNCTKHNYFRDRDEANNSCLEGTLLYTYETNFMS